VDASAKAPFADPTTGTARVDADPEAYARRVLFHAMVACGASFIGRVDLMQAHYHAAMSRVGPLFARPSLHTICALILLSMLTRLISSDVTQSICMLRLARSMVKDVDGDAEHDDDSSAALCLLDGDGCSTGLTYAGLDDDAMSLGGGSLTGEVAAALRSEREEATASTRDSDDLFAGFGFPSRRHAPAAAKRRKTDGDVGAVGGMSAGAASVAPPSARLLASTPSASVASVAASTETFVDGHRLHAVREGLTVRVKLVRARLLAADMCTAQQHAFTFLPCLHCRRRGWDWSSFCTSSTPGATDTQRDHHRTCSTTHLHHRTHVARPPPHTQGTATTAHVTCLQAILLHTPLPPPCPFHPRAHQRGAIVGG